MCSKYISVLYLLKAVSICLLSTLLMQGPTGAKGKMGRKGGFGPKGTPGEVGAAGLRGPKVCVKNCCMDYIMFDGSAQCSELVYVDKLIIRK